MTKILQRMVNSWIHQKAAYTEDQMNMIAEAIQRVRLTSVLLKVDFFTGTVLLLSGNPRENLRTAVTLSKSYIISHNVNETGKLVTGIHRDAFIQVC
jgi:hypothetical protein